MRADGSGAEALIENGINPSWSPDGTKIVYFNSAGSWLIDIHEGVPRQIVSATGNDPDWRP